MEEMAEKLLDLLLTPMITSSRFFVLSHKFKELYALKKKKKRQRAIAVAQR